MVVAERVDDPVREPPAGSPESPERSVVDGSVADRSGLAPELESGTTDRFEATDSPEADSVADGSGVPAPRDGKAGPGGGPRLDPREEMILAFERRWWRHAGAKEQAIRDTFGLSPTRYYQLLNALLDSPAALAHDPVLVNRLRRLRVSRARSRPR